MSWRRGKKKKPDSPLKILMKALRRTDRYEKWKDAVFRREIKTYPKIPRNIQVHHRIHLSDLLKEYKIETVLQALRCPALWKPELGICVTRGEHFVIHKLERIKYPTEGFILLLGEEYDRLIKLVGAIHVKRRTKEEKTSSCSLSRNEKNKARRANRRRKAHR